MSVVLVPPLVPVLAAFVGLANAAPVQLSDAQLDRIVAAGEGNGNGNGNIGNNNGNGNQGNGNGNGNLSSGNGNGNTTDNNGNGPLASDPFYVDDILEIGGDTKIARRELGFVFDGADTDSLSNRYVNTILGYGFTLYGNDGSAFQLFADRVRSLVLPAASSSGL